MWLFVGLGELLGQSLFYLSDLMNLRLKFTNLGCLFLAFLLDQKMFSVQLLNLRLLLTKWFFSHTQFTFNLGDLGGIFLLKRLDSLLRLSLYLSQNTFSLFGCSAGFLFRAHQKLLDSLLVAISHLVHADFQRFKLIAIANCHRLKFFNLNSEFIDDTPGDNLLPRDP